MISIIIPAFNESENLKKNIPNLVKYLNSRKMKYEIIISEDGSTDDTHEILKMLSKTYGVRFTHENKRLGKGGSLKKASSIVKGDKVIFIDADMPVNLDSLIVMNHELEKNDVVIGSRCIKGSRSFRTFKRSFLSRIYHLLIRLVFPEFGMSDMKCGVKGFKKDVFVSVSKVTKENGWSWDLEFLIRARKKGFKIKEIPVEWYESINTKLNLTRDSFLQLIDIFVIRFRVLRQEK